MPSGIVAHYREPRASKTCRRRPNLKFKISSSSCHPERSENVSLAKRSTQSKTLTVGIHPDKRGSAQHFSTFYLRRFYRIFPLYGVIVAIFTIEARAGVIVARSSRRGHASSDSLVGLCLAHAEFLDGAHRLVWAAGYVGNLVVGGRGAVLLDRPLFDTKSSPEDIWSAC